MFQTQEEGSIHSRIRNILSCEILLLFNQDLDKNPESQSGKWSFYPDEEYFYKEIPI